jgi:hypothetical protein
MPVQSLPIIHANPAIDHSQGKLIEVFQKLVASYNPPGELPFDTAGGMCSGIGASWLYRKRVGEEELFLNRLEFALTATIDKHTIPTISDLMNEINFFQLDHRLRDEVLQDSYAASFDYVLPKNYPRVMPAEFAISFVFNLKSLAQLIIDTAFENKMVRLDNGFHTLSLMYSNKKYWMLDPESPHGPIEFEASKIYDLAQEIITGLSKTCKSVRYIAIYMTIHDIDFEPLQVQYPDAIDYCKNLLAEPDYKQAVITHKNILHLNMRFNNYKFQDLLFPDYKYIPWELTKDTEYEEAIIANNSEKIRYLAANGIPLDYKAPGIVSVQPVTRAIFLNRMDMLYLLLKLGANPNVIDQDYPPRLKYVLVTNNIEALILLLAAGMDLNESDMKEVIQHFKLTSSQLYAMTAHVLLIHAKMFGNPKPVAPIMLDKLDNFVRRRTKEVELTAEHRQEMEVMLDTLQQVSETSCDITERAMAAQNLISKYVPPRAKPVVFSNSTTGSVDFARDIRPLLTLSFN